MHVPHTTRLPRRLDDRCPAGLRRCQLATVRPVTPPPVYDPDVEQVLARARSLGKVKVAGTLRGLHPLVLAAKERLEGAEPNQYHMLTPYRTDGAKGLQVSVTKGGLRRALLFLDALVKAIEGLRGEIEVRSSPWETKTIVSFCGEGVARILLRERYRQRPREKPPGATWGWPSYDYEPTGRLVLESGGYGRAHCQDTEKGRRVEDGISKLLVRWVAEAGRLRNERQRAEEERRRREEEERVRREREAELQRRRQELQEKQRAEQARVDALLAEATAWRQSQTLRDYIRAVEQLVTARAGPIDLGSDTARRLEWARQQADRLDPLTPSPPSVLDERA